MRNSGETFKIIYAKSVKHDVKKIPKRDLLKIKQEIEKLKQFPEVSQVRKLIAHPIADFRLRVGEYRILFDIDLSSRRVVILKISHRKDSY